MGISPEQLREMGYDANGNRLKNRRKPDGTMAPNPKHPKDTKRLERKFDDLWERCGGPPLENEYRFHPDRRWRFDRALVAKKVAFELHGGLYSQGRHTRGSGFANDRQKMNAAIRCGWRVIELTDHELTQDAIQQYVAFCVNDRDREAGQA